MSTVQQVRVLYLVCSASGFGYALSPGFVRLLMREIQELDFQTILLIFLVNLANRATCLWGQYSPRRFDVVLDMCFSTCITKGAM